jgi:hypothetical protein
LINVALTPVRSYNLIASIKDIHSVVSLGNEDQKDGESEFNVLVIHSHLVEATNEQVTEPLLLSLPQDAFRDASYMSWVLANKLGEESTTDDFQDLMHSNYLKVKKNGALGGLELLVAKA